ncbi:hypothetical protein BDF14DRAFT_1741397 [Spinellus fusiger]|nr:hypothetical protein BDF14DRAFT_1741397 [Spinellus fusiger]
MSSLYAPDIRFSESTFASLHQENAFASSAPTTSYRGLGSSSFTDAIGQKSSPRESFLSTSPFHGLLSSSLTSQSYSYASQKSPLQDTGYFDYDLNDALLPSSLNDLLTPSELEIRRARERASKQTEDPLCVAESHGAPSFLGAPHALTGTAASTANKSSLVSQALSSQSWHPSPLLARGALAIGAEYRMSVQGGEATPTGVSSHGLHYAMSRSPSQSMHAPISTQSTMSTSIGIPTGHSSHSFGASREAILSAKNDALDFTDTHLPMFSTDDDVQFFMEEYDATDKTIVPVSSSLPSFFLL